MGLILSILLGFLPMLGFAAFVYWLDQYEKEPKLLIGGVFTWGAVVAAGAAFIVNTVLGIGVYLFTGSESATDFTTSAVFAPVVEESLKGLAVMIVFLLFRREFDSILDGIVYAAIAALGFAATENAFYIYTYGFLEDGFAGIGYLTFVRVILVGWQHPFYTAFIGIGLAIARLNRHAILKLLAPAVGWMIAVSAHSLHNAIAVLATGAGGLIFGTALDWLGWLFMFIFILWTINREQRLLVQHLHEEVSLGSITPQQYRTACSAWSQNTARLSALFRGQYGPTNRFYQICAELVHKKHQLGQMGDEAGNQVLIQQLRQELARLSPGMGR